MSGGMPELGSKISLISKADIRYEGRLYTVDPQECTIALSNVRSFGTEDRETQFQIAPQSQIYDYILFRGSDIKDIRVVNNSLPHPNDPAIMQVQLQNGQHMMPHFPMPSMNPPHAPPMNSVGYGNPFGMGSLGGMGGSGAGGAPSMAPGTGAPGPYMLGGNQQQQPPPQEQQQQQQQQPQQQQQQQQHQNQNQQQQKTQQQQQQQPQRKLSELLLSSNNQISPQQQAQQQQRQHQQQAQAQQQQQQSVHHNASTSNSIPSNQAQLKSDSNSISQQMSLKQAQSALAIGGSGSSGSGAVAGANASADSGSSLRVGSAVASSGVGLISGLLGSGGGGGAGAGAGTVGALGAGNNAKKLIPHAALKEHKDQVPITDMLTSRSTTPNSRASPDLINMNMKEMGQHKKPQQNQNTAGHGANSRDAGHKRQNHPQRGNYNPRSQHNGNGIYHSMPDRRDSGRNMDYNNQHHETRTNYNNQRSHQGGGGGGGGGSGGGGSGGRGGGGGGIGGGGQNRAWTMHRGPVNSQNMIRNRGGGGGGGRGRMQNQGFGLRSINKNTIKFEQDFDFEQANNKFEELRSQLSKLKVGDEPKSEQMNGETDKKDDSGNETGAGEHEPEEEEITVGYDKTKSFFDNISCEAAQDRSKNKKNDWRQERKLNSETFGASSMRRGGYRGRGNYYNRNVGSFGGGYNRNYRGGNNYRNRTRNSNAGNSNSNSNTNNAGGSASNAAAGVAANSNGNSGANSNSTTLKNQTQQPQASVSTSGSTANAAKTAPVESNSTPQQVATAGGQ